MPEEDHGRGPHGFDLRRAQDEFQGGADVVDEVLHDPQVVQGAEDRAEEDDHGQHVAGEDESAVLAEQAAEDEGRAFAGEVDEFLDGVRGALERLEAGLPFQHEQGEQHLQAEADAEGAPVDGFAVLGEGDGDAEDQDDAEQTL